MENTVIPRRIQMERFIPVENFRKKSNSFQVLPFSRFDRNDQKFFVPLWLTSSSAKLPVEAEGEKWRSFPRRVMVFCKWYNSNTFLFSETFSSPVPLVRNLLPKFPNKWQTFSDSPRFPRVVFHWLPTI